MDAVKNIKRGVQEIGPPVGFGPESEGEGREGRGEGDVRGNGVGEVREDGGVEDGVVREGGVSGGEECVLARNDGADNVREGTVDKATQARLPPTTHRVCYVH